MLFFTDSSLLLPVIAVGSFLHDHTTDYPSSVDRFWSGAIMSSLGQVHISSALLVDAFFSRVVVPIYIPSVVSTLNS
jgi:hypothetical protein